MKSLVTIQLVADYGFGDLAFSEVTQKLLKLDPNLRVYQTNVPKFSTLATGFIIGQLALVNSFPELVIFSNTAPRKKLDGFTATIDGGYLAFTQLKNGVKIIAVNQGFNLAFIKPEIHRLYKLNVDNVKSQFRSRDFYPEAVVKVIHGDKEILGDQVNQAEIADIPEKRIAYIDGYGNMKTTMRQSMCPFAVGTKISLTLNQISQEVLISDETYNVKDGLFSFGAGSSGGADRFMEIWIRGGNAWQAFGQPELESKFDIETI